MEKPDSGNEGLLRNEGFCAKRSMRKDQLHIQRGKSEGALTEESAGAGERGKSRTGTSGEGLGETSGLQKMVSYWR